MKIFNSLRTKIHFFSLFSTLAIATVVFSFPAESESIRQAPPFASKQIEALPRSTTTSQPSDDRVALYQALLDLASPWTVMCIAAHPDDEDGTSLIVMRRKYGEHTVSLFSTFGEGGQNAIGPELYEELGAIRARETMAAAEIQGSEPYFLGLKDFGYSKSAEEAFKFWGHDEALRRMVLQIRKLRPDVIITNHSVTNNDHGHHQATARLVLEAFDATADPKRFPEQLKAGVTIWQVKRLFVRARGNQAQADNPQLVTIDPNARDINRNTTFAEEALSALQKHATQGPWPKTVAQMAARFTNSSDGRLPLIRYRLVREATGAEPLTRDADSFLAGLVIPREMQPRLVPWNSDDSWISLNEREQVLPKLLAMAKAFHQRNSPQDIMAMPAVAALDKKLNVAIAAAAGISAKLISSDNVLIPGKPGGFSLVISNSNSLELRPKLFFSGVGDDFRHVNMFMDRPSSMTVGKDKTVAIFAEGVPKNAAPTIPHSEHLYDGRFAGVPVTVSGLVEIGGQDIPLFASTFIDVTPPVEIERIDPSPLILTPMSVNKTVTFTIRLINHEKTPFNGILSAQGKTVAVSLPAQGPQAVQLKLSQGLPAKTSELRFTVSGSAAQSATIPVAFADAKIAPNLRVGYIRGFDYSLPHALAALRVQSKELSVDEVKTADLSKFTSIIVDNRVYESQPELIEANQKLLDYAKNGGTLIVFYHKSFEWNPDERRKRPQLAPYKLILGDERITDENAPVTFIEPQHLLLNFPNKINQEDFVGWIQERGLYYPKDWDANYHALLASNDPGEASLKGGLLVADYSRGHYIYSSMVWYRQLRAGVPGAYRMLANMISYGQAK